MVGDAAAALQGAPGTTVRGSRPCAPRATRRSASRLRTFIGAFASFVKGAFGGAPDAPLTVEEKAAAAAKRKSTRAARNTMESKQKKAGKGAPSRLDLESSSAKWFAQNRSRPIEGTSTVRKRAADEPAPAG